jgi:serine/threonine-protein phosphatase 2A regulatory subunit A
VSDDILGGKEGIISVIISLTHDQIPNVRFLAVKCLRVLYNITDSILFKKEIRIGMERLLADDDVDVRYFAEEALQGLK